MSGSRVSSSASKVVVAGTAIPTSTTKGMVVQMISVGEQTGALDEMLDKVADFYDSEVDTAVDALTAAIEPIMIVGMGAIVGGMLVAMYLPMFSLISQIG